jgi:hypothetical protein
MEVLYNHIKDYSVREVLNSTRVGFSFEFYNARETPFIAEDLSRICSKTVAVTSEKNMIPTWDNPILLKEYEGKNPKYKFTTSPQDFFSVEPMLSGILEWISQNSKTDKGTGLQVVLSFNNGTLQTLNTISNMDVTKLVLRLDENYLYQRFPERKNSPHAISIKGLLPANEFLSSPGAIGSFKNYFLYPSAPYYGIDFTDQHLGELKFNYIGGKDYSKNHKNVFEALNYYILTTYQALNIPGYTAEMGINLEKIYENYHIIRRIYYDPKWFLENIKDIQVGVDLKRDGRIIETFWPKLRDPLTKLMLENGFIKGKFNWDSEGGRFQVKEAELIGGKISKMDIVDCKIQGIIEDCGIWNTKIKNSRIIFSTLVESNKIEDSILERVRADRNNSITKSWIYNSGEVLNCDINESIIKDAAIGKQAKLDEECLIIEPKRKSVILPKPVSVEEIRDYRWLAGLNKDRKDKGYQNEFKHKW